MYPPGKDGGRIRNGPIDNDEGKRVTGIALYGIVLHCMALYGIVLKAATSERLWLNQAAAFGNAGN